MTTRRAERSDSKRMPKWVNENRRICWHCHTDQEQLKKALRTAWKVLSENCRCVEFGLNDFECPICIALFKIDKLGNGGKP